MSSREQYAPGAASGAEVRKDGEKWTLVLVRDLPHPPAKVWKALTDPEHLREWAPFDSDRNLGTVGTAKLSTAGEVRRTSRSQAWSRIGDTIRNPCQLGWHGLRIVSPDLWLVPGAVDQFLGQAHGDGGAAG